MKYPQIDRSVMVTGCSTGIGRATAERLKADGWEVFPTARKEDDLAALRELGFTAIALDVADAASVERAADEVLERTGGRLGGLVNNAGVGQPGAVEDLTREALRYQFEVNVFGLQDLTRRLAPGFRKQGAGRIVNVSSVLGQLSPPFLGAYAATKHAVGALSDSLRIELRGSGVAVAIVEPGPIITRFRYNAVAKAEEHLELGASPFAMLFMREMQRRQNSVKKQNFFNRPPEDVARKIHHALTASRPRRYYRVTPPAYFGAWMRRLAPRALIDHVFASHVAKLQARARAREESGERGDATPA